MAEKTPHSEERHTPAAPTLLFPREEAVVNCQGLRFVWEASEGATAYRIEIAADTGFQQIVFAEEVGSDVTSISTEGILPADESTYFWRVIASDGTKWSHGENIESFICGTEEEVRAGITSPDLDEEFGPVAKLFKGAGVEMAADLSDSERVQRLEEEMGVAHEGVEAKQIMGFVLAVIVALVVLVIVVVNLTSSMTQTVRATWSSQATYLNLEETEARALEQINTYGIIDEEEGRYRIPIDRAIELMVEEQSADAP